MIHFLNSKLRTSLSGLAWLTVLIALDKSKKSTYIYEIYFIN